MRLCWHRRIFTLFLFLLCAGIPKLSYSKNPSAQLSFQNQSIKKLSFDEQSLEVQQATINGEKYHYVELSGRFLRDENWSLIAGSRKAQRNNQGDFSVKVLIRNKISFVEFTAVGPLGEVEKTKITITAEQFNEYMASGSNEAAFHQTAAESNTLGLKIIPGIGYSALEWKDPGGETLTESTLTAKVSADYPIGDSRFSLGGNIYSSVAILSKNTSSHTHFMGTNIRGGYRLPYLKQPWSLRLYGGIYFTTTFGGTSDFGYENLIGPQIYPTLTYTFQNGAMATTYFKYSPVANGVGFYTLDNRELATGGAYYFPSIKKGVLKGSSVGLTVDLSWLDLKTSAGNVQLQTLSLGAAIRF